MNFKKYTITILSVLLLISCSKDDDNGNNNQGFITIWQTTTSNDDITIYTNSSYTYNYTVDWGDGTISNNAIGTISHTYATAGAHTVTITGDFPAIRSLNAHNASKLQSIESWGNISWKYMKDAFRDCENLKLNTSQAPNLSNVTDLSGMFDGATSFNQDISNWDVSSVTNMTSMFRSANSFDQNISDWDVSNVTTMEYMFYGATSFNQNLSGWATDNVTACDYFSVSSALTSENRPTRGSCFY